MSGGVGKSCVTEYPSVKSFWSRMSPDQKAILEQAEHDLRMDLKRLSEPSMNEMPYIREMRDLLRAAHGLIEAVLLERPVGMGKPDRVIDGTPKKIA